MGTRSSTVWRRRTAGAALRRTRGRTSSISPIHSGWRKNESSASPGTSSTSQRRRTQKWGDTRSQARSTPVAGASMMAPLPTTAPMHMTAKKTLYLANPYGFSAQQRGGPLHALVRALESMGADVWEPFARNNQIDRTSAGWAYRIGQADLRDVRTRRPACRPASSTIAAAPPPAT